MEKFKIPIAFLLFALYLCALCVVGSRSDLFAAGDTDRFYYYLAACQSPLGPVGKDFFSTKEQALCVLAFLNRGHYNRAKRILNFYYDIYRVVKSSGNFWGFAERYDKKCSAVVDNIDYFSQTLMLNAIVNYTVKTGDKKFLLLARDIGDVFARRINPWGAFSMDDGQMYARENLCAFVVFRELARITEDTGYAKTAKRLQFVLEDLFFDETKKMLRYKLLEDKFVPEDQILGKLVLNSGIKKASEAPRNSDWHAFRMLDSTLSENNKNLEEFEEKIKFPPDCPDGSYISKLDGTADLTATAIYLFIKERFNLFGPVGPDKRMSLISVPRGETYTNEKFEDDTINFYMVMPPRTVNSEVSISNDYEVKKEGERSLRIQFSPLKDEKSSAEITRIFYPPQDFSKFGRMKFWLRSRAGNVMLGHLSLKIKMRIVDADGNVGESRLLNHSARGVENTLIFPGAFMSIGKNPVNTEKIQKLVWVFEETTRNPWNFQIDEIRME